MAVKKRVVALGFFDGVHLGHQALMRTARERAAELGAQPAVITFDAHPDEFVRGTAAPLLGSAEDRKDVISRVGGIDDIIMLHFDREFMRTPWMDFVRTVKDELGAVHLIMGRDFCCGWRGEGTAERIAAWCGANGLGYDIIEEVVLDGIVVSSTYIRQLVAAGDMEQAARFLGHPYALCDTVEHGCQRGRRIGAPTINTRIQPGVIVPRYGVYITQVWLGGKAHHGVTNVGVRPTFESDRQVTVETNILDFSGQLYGIGVRVEFLRFIRDEIRFSSQEALAGQIQKDVAAARRYFQEEAAGA